MAAELDISVLRRHAEARLREERKDLNRGLVSWSIPKVLSASVVGVVATALLPVSLGGWLGDVDVGSAPFWMRILAPVAVAVLGVPSVYLMMRRRAQKDTEELTQEWKEQWIRLTRPGWWKRVLRWGVGLGVAGGALLGVMMAILWPEADLLGGDRLTTLLGMAALTSGWTIPAAFGLRSLTLRSYRVRGLMLPEPATHRLGGSDPQDRQ